MPINPIHFAHSVCDEFLRYIFSAFPLSDPQLAEQARKLLKRSSSLDIPLVRGPYVSLSEAFAHGELVQAMADRGLLHHAMPGLIGYPTMWLHQQQVFQAVRSGRHALVATGTGSGKTEAFLYPIVDSLLRERDAGVTSGLSAILIYPMNALANDQLDRLREMLAGTRITFGQWIGTTPDKEKDVSIERFTGSSRQAYLAERKRRREEAHAEDRAARPLAPPEECCSEEDIRQRQPRILLTNYRQLEILTTRYPDVTLFAGAPLQYLVFDEAHTYEGAQGAEVACLIRRVRALAGRQSDEVTCIGTSATLTDPESGNNEAVARRFASRFFGVDAERVALIGESYVEREWPRARYKPAAPLGDGMERLSCLLKALGDPVDVPALRRVVEELTGQMFHPGPSWSEALFQHLISNEYVYQATQILSQPRELDEAAWLTSQRIAPDRLPQGERASAELLAYLALGAAAQLDGGSLLRPKVHFFIRGLDEMVVALNGTPEATKVDLFMSLADAREAHPGRRDGAFLPVLTCRNCGQHFFEQHYADLELARGAGNHLRDFDQGAATEAEDGSENAVWSTGTEETGKRLLMTNRLLEEAETGQEGVKSSRYPRAWICRACGALHRNPADRCCADGCGQPEPLLPLIAIGDTLSSCPSCSSPSIVIGGRTIEPAKAIKAVVVADVHILAQAMINAAPPGHEKLIIFADSRQEAAFQAGWMQDHARRIRLRHMFHQVIAERGQGLKLDAIVDGVMEIFRRDKSLIDALLPELTGEEAQANFGHNVWVPVHRALRYMVLREFTTGIRRRDCLESMGLSRVSYARLTPQHPRVQDWASLLGLTPEDAVNGIALILDIWRRNRILFVASDPIFSRFHAKDDPYIQAGLLNLREFRPEGLLLKAGEHKYARGVLAQRGASAVQALVKKWVENPANIDVDLAATMLWELLVQEKLLARTTLRSYKGTELGADVWQVNADKVLVEKSAHRERCTTCQRVMTRTAPREACTQHNCRGRTVGQEPDREDYDVWLMGRPFIMVAAEEHTAQVPGEMRALIEQEFKSKSGRTNCLVATPTLEMGVNIGLLDMALLRNVPPRTSNYWQRAGRAGREERMAVVVTYCGPMRHDRYFFDDPLRLLGGGIKAPTFNIKNPLMIAKHIRSAILSELLLRARDGGDSGERILDVTRELFPTFIRKYLLDEEDQFRDSPPSVVPLRELLETLHGDLTQRLVLLFAQNWPEEAREFATPEAISQMIRETPAALEGVLRTLHRRLTWARFTRADLHRRKDAGLIEREEEQLLWRCDDYIRKIVRQDRSTYTLTVLGVEGFLPGYGVYEGGVTAQARRGFARHPGTRTFDLSRSQVVGLREFVPGNRLYANRGTFYVSRYHLRADEGSAPRTLRVDVEKGFVTDSSGSAAYGQSGGTVIEALPLTDLDLAHESRITEEEHLRFSMPVSILGRYRRRHRGGKTYKIADLEVQHLRGQGLELVNLGEAGEVRKNRLGHLICSVCGAAKTPYAVQAEIARFLKLHQERCGKEPTKLALTACSEVDILQFHAIESQEKGINIGEALRTAGVRLLDMGQEDVQLLIVQKPDETLDLVMYDPMPGGSGLLEQMIGRWRELIAAARELLTSCPRGCETACYSCLKTYRNQFHHELLNRHKALEFLEELDAQPEHFADIRPIFEEEPAPAGSPSNTREAQLHRILLDHHFPAGKCRETVKTTGGLSTVPDWLHESSKTAIYLDGMSRNLHGDPRTAQMDRLIRGMLELEGYKVIVIQSRDLDDPEALRQHLRNIAQSIGRDDLL